MWDRGLFFYSRKKLQIKAAGTGPSITHPRKYWPKPGKMEVNPMKNNMKKFLAAALSLTVLLSLAACGEKTGGGSGSSGQPAPAGSGSATEDTGFKVAIVKQMDHPSLDEIAAAVAARLDEIAAGGEAIEYEIYSGQGDESVLTQIGAQVVADEVSVIIPIASTAAQLMAVAAEGTGIPVVYAAVSDPEQADLLGIDYVTGTCDALNTPFILDMMLAQNPDIERVGLLYSLSEPNSYKPIADAKAYLEEKGIRYEEATANTPDEVISAARSLNTMGVEAIFTPTDNIIMSAELAIYEDLMISGIPHYTGADSFVRNGAFATCGVNYTQLGTETADLAYDVLLNGIAGKEDYYLSDGGIITVNTETAAGLGIDYALFQDMGQVVEVITTVD